MGYAIALCYYWISTVNNQSLEQQMAYAQRTDQSISARIDLSSLRGGKRCAQNKGEGLEKGFLSSFGRSN